jgi:hypothetical protein
VAEPKPFDWSNSTKPQRRKLYEAYRLVFADTRSMHAAIVAALGKKAVGDRYVENFAQSRSAIGHSLKLYEYLQLHHRAAADDLMRTLTPGLITPWEAYYRKHRRDDRLAVALSVEHTSPLFREPPGIKQLFDDDAFYLQLDSDIEGYAIGFWKHREHWFRLLYGPTPVTIGRQWITRDDVMDHPTINAIFGGPTGTGEIRPITYRGRERFPEFVVIVGDLPTVEQMTDNVGRFDLPFLERTLDMFPSILETSNSAWRISWVKPSFVSQDSFYSRSE